MTSTRPCSSRLAASALKSASDIHRIHGGRPRPPRSRPPFSGGRRPSSGGGGGKFVEGNSVAFVPPASLGGGPRRGNSRSREGPLVGRGNEGRTTVGLLVTPSGLTFAPSTGRTKVTYSSDQRSRSPRISRESRLVSPAVTTGSPSVFNRPTAMRPLDLTRALVRFLTSSLRTRSRRS